MLRYEIEPMMPILGGKTTRALDRGTGTRLHRHHSWLSIFREARL